MKTIYYLYQIGKRRSMESIEKGAAKIRGIKRSKEFCENAAKRLRGIKRRPEYAIKTKLALREKYGTKVLINGVKYDSIAEAVEKTRYTKSIIQRYIRNVIKNVTYDIKLA